MSQQDAELARVEEEVRAALAGRPDQAGLWAALGLVRIDRGDLAGGVDHLARAASLAPDDGRIQSDYGAALTTAGRAAEAESVLRRALALTGGDDNLHFNLARSLHVQGRTDEALAALARVREQADDVLKLSGDLHQEKGDWQRAASDYFAALRLRPDHPAYLNDLGVLLELNGGASEHLALWQRLTAGGDAPPVAWFFLGNALAAQSRMTEALAAYERATALDPDFAEALNNRALVLGKLGREDEALACLGRATEIDPGLVAARTNLGCILSRNNALAEAEAMLARAVALDPASTDARVNYGALLMRQRRFSEAEALFRAVLAEVPGHPSAELNMGLLKLNQGELEQGWPYYESRWKMPQMAGKRPALTSPEWDGRPLDGRTLFVFAEQGFGDNLQFVRYLDEIHARFPSARVVFYALHQLAALLGACYRSDWCRVIPWGEPIPPHDAHIPLLSLPWRCATGVATIPARVPYLRADTARLAPWRARLQAAPGLRVGLVWSTSETFIYRSAKTVALKTLEPLLAVPGVSWVNLQFGKDAEEISALGWGGRFLDPMPEVRDFADTAALVEALDLVISVDTAVAHLAGALARPVWMLDRYDTDWRWLPPREDSPWYPTLRLFRQEAFGDWTPVVRRAAAALHDLSGRPLAAALSSCKESP